jgi:LysM repeat protein
MITRTLRGLAALLALALTLIGWPLLLLWLAGQVSAWLPDLSDPIGLLSRPDAGGLFLLIVLALGWLAWAVWLVAVLVEAAAQTRGIPTPRLGGLFPQHSAAALVTALAVAFTTTAAPAALATPPPAASTQAAAATSPTQQAPSAVPAAPAVAGDTQLDAEAEADVSTDYVVQRGDTLWAIADEQLDDPARYPEIAAASEGITQPDGQHLTDPDLILPGWTLHVPDDHPTATATDQDVEQPASDEQDPAQAAGQQTPEPAAAEESPEPPDSVRLPDTPLHSPTPDGAGTTTAAAASLPTTPLPAAEAAGPGSGGARSASAPVGPPAPVLPVTPLSGGATTASDPAVRDAVYDDEGRFDPDHGVLGLPNWITGPLTPVRAEDAPEVIAEAQRILAAHSAALRAQRDTSQ